MPYLASRPLVSEPQKCEKRLCCRQAVPHRSMCRAPLPQTRSVVHDVPTAGPHGQQIRVLREFAPPNLPKSPKSPQISVSDPAIASESWMQPPCAPSPWRCRHHSSPSHASSRAAQTPAQTPRANGLPAAGLPDAGLPAAGLPTGGLPARGLRAEGCTRVRVGDVGRREAEGVCRIAPILSCRLRTSGKGRGLGRR